MCNDYVAAVENVFAHVVGHVVVVIISSRSLRPGDIISLGASAVAKIRAEREPLGCPEKGWLSCGGRGKMSECVCM